ncbi:MAG: type II toxin-antitoxin system RelE family toxin, partial [Nitrososphaera sp.]
DLWLEDNLLTGMLCEYIRQYQVARVFDLTALVAYRNLIDWSKVAATGTDVLHCFDSMSAGDYALIPFGQLMKNTLLEASEDTLINLEPEAKMGNVVLRSVKVTQSGLPDEVQQIQSAEKEVPLLQPQTIDFVDEVLRGGHPIPMVETKNTSRKSRADWLFAVTSQFRKGYHEDKILSAQILAAILKICRDPLTPHGDTIKPIVHNKALKGKWRYRLGDHRLIYWPDKSNHTVYLLKISSRGDPELYE